MFKSGRTTPPYYLSRETDDPTTHIKLEQIDQQQGQHQQQQQHGGLMLARSGSLDEHYELAAFQRHQQSLQQSLQQQQEQIANYVMQLHEIDCKFSGVERDAVVKME